MPLYKSHCLDYSEDFGLLLSESDAIHFYENGIQKTSERLQLSPVIRVNALWVEKDLKIKCEIADTLEKKKFGLQGHKCLEQDSGMYFPYEPFSQVAFHQGTVPFSLDLVFLCENQVLQTKENTEVGGTDKWACAECDGVIEVVGGWCKTNSVEVGDRVCLSAVSEQDIEELERQKQDDFRASDRVGWLVALAEMV
jgi:uncharacterized membrane protein (UPF0127 family)